MAFVSAVTVFGNGSDSHNSTNLIIVNVTRMPPTKRCMWMSTIISENSPDQMQHAFVLAQMKRYRSLYCKSKEHVAYCLLGMDKKNNIAFNNTCTIYLFIYCGGEAFQIMCLNSS